MYTAECWNLKTFHDTVAALSSGFAQPAAGILYVVVAVRILVKVFYHESPSLSACPPSFAVL